MGSVIEQEFSASFGKRRRFFGRKTRVAVSGLNLSRRKTTRRVKIALGVFYALALPAFIIIGLQPADTSAEVRASEVAQAEEYLEINSIGLSTPVIKIGLNRNTLNAPQYLVGAYHSHENKTLLIGHSSTIFGGLNQISLGDHIDYEDGTYIVTDLTTLEKSAINMSEILKDESEPTLILMTCAGEPLGGMDFSHRLIITAVKLQ